MRISRRAVLTGVCVVGLVAVALVGALPAQAAFPGANGRIAFDRFTSIDQIVTINPDGSGFTPLTSDSANSDFIPVYSADGGMIAFSRTGSSDTAIWVMNADGSGAHRLTTPPVGSTDILPGSFSPDGRQVVFERDASGSERVFVVNIDGSNPHQLLTPPGGSADENPTFSPDGRRIAFVREDATTDKGQLMLANADGTGSATPLTNPPAGFGDHDPNFSPDGTKITFGRSTVEPANDSLAVSDVYTIKTDGSGEQKLTNETLSNESEDPAFSPDGSMIVFGRCVFAGTSCDLKQLLTMRADGSGRRPLTSSVSGQFDASPSWQPIKFSFGKLKRNQKRGTAKQKVIIGAAGTLALSGKGIKAKTLHPAAGTITLPIKPIGKTRKRELLKHKVRVKITVTFTPTGSFPSALGKKAKLKVS